MKKKIIHPAIIFIAVLLTPALAFIGLVWSFIFSIILNILSLADLFINRVFFVSFILGAPLLLCAALGVVLGKFFTSPTSFLKNNLPAFLPLLLPPALLAIAYMLHYYIDFYGTLTLEVITIVYLVTAIAFSITSSVTKPSQNKFKGWSCLLLLFFLELNGLFLLLF